jgi:hypothetical protein
MTSTSCFPYLRFLSIEGEDSVVVDVLDIRHKEYLASLFSRETEITLGRVSVPVVSKEDLFILKRLSSRPKDRLDADEMERDLKDLDRSYIDRWLKELRP